MGRILPVWLAKNGYDVWVGTSRGTSYPEYSDHTEFDVWFNPEQFWNFTIDSMAEFDVPAMLDYIFQETSATNVSYIGHNIGASSLLKAMEKGTLNKQIDTITILQPCFAPKFGIYNITD